MQTGLQRALTVSVEHPDRYDAAVTLAEFQLAAGRAAGDADALARALVTLDARRGVCLAAAIAILFLRARTRVERARMLIATGGDPSMAREDLDSVLGAAAMSRKRTSPTIRCGRSCSATPSSSTHNSHPIDRIDRSSTDQNVKRPWSCSQRGVFHCCVTTPKFEFVGSVFG